MTFEKLHEERLQSWCQDGVHRIPDPDAGIDFIDKVGLCTLYLASSEFPNLFHGHLSNPTAKPDAKWDSVSGEIYTWRWKIGKKDAAFYAGIVAKKPTWVSWPLLPPVLAAAMERRTPDELFDLGLISQDAHRIATVLDDAGGVLSTKDLRARAGFPTGKDNRKAYLKAVEELEAHLLLAKKMAEGEGDDNMSHALIPTYYRTQTDEAIAMSPEQGLRTLLDTYLPNAAYVEPDPFAKALRIPKAVVLRTLEEMRANHFEHEGKNLFYLD